MWWLVPHRDFQIWSDNMLLVMALPIYNPDEIENAIQRDDFKFGLESAMPHASLGIQILNAQSP